MRIVHLTPGTGSFYCGSCVRDHDLVRALRALGHDVLMVPLYLPFVTDEPLEDDVGPVFLGGVNMYLKQKSALFRKLPRFLTRILDCGQLLRAAGKRAGMTDAKLLGAMTLSSFEGMEGKQRGEFQRLIHWLKRETKADLFSLSNGLLSGIAVALKKEFNKPVVCTLHGEDTFLDSLPYPYREQCWDKFIETSASVDQYFAVSEYYASELRRRLHIEDGKIEVVWNGVDTERFQPPEKRPEGRAIGYLARMMKAKGLSMLFEAFMVLRATGQANDVRLRIAGTMTDADKPFVDDLKKQIAAVGLEGDVDFLPNLTLDEKIEFLHSISVMCVPATYGEAFGLYLIEAMACGVPFVQPKHAAFPEIARESKGGVLCEPENSIDLAGALQELLSDRELRENLGNIGRENVVKKFSSKVMAEKFAGLCEALTQSTKSP